jgi:hypothetical protein
MIVNQNGDEVIETTLFTPWVHEDVTDDERDHVIALILQHLGLEAVRTNATKRGHTEVDLRPRTIY